MIKRILGGECWLMVKWKLTFVYPIRHPVINGPDDSGVRDLIVDGHFRFRPIIDVVLIHVDQSVAARCPTRQLQKNRIVPRQRALRSGKLINSNNRIYVSSIGFFFWEMERIVSGIVFWKITEEVLEMEMKRYSISDSNGVHVNRFRYCFYVWLENGEGKRVLFGEWRKRIARLYLF